MSDVSSVADSRVERTVSTSRTRHSLMTRRHSEPCPSEAAVRADLEPRDSHDLEEVFPRSQQADPPDVPVLLTQLTSADVDTSARAVRSLTAVVMSAPSLGDELVAQGLLDDLFPFLKPPSLHSRRTRCTVAELLKSLMGAGIPLAMGTSSFWNARIASSLVDVLMTDGHLSCQSGLFERAVAFVCHAHARRSAESFQFQPRELMDLMHIIGHSHSSQEQQATLKVVARIAAMSPVDGAILVDGGLVSMLVDVLGYVDGPESIMDSYSSILEDRDTRQPANPALAPKIAWAMGALASCESSAETVLNQGGCAAMIRLLSTSQAASQDAAIFTIASLMKWDLAGVRRSFARHQGASVLVDSIWRQHQDGTLLPRVLWRCFEVLCWIMAADGHAQGGTRQNMGDTFVLNTQLVVSRGIYMLVELAEDSNEDIRAPALRTLYHLTNTNRRFKSILARATQDHALLAAIASAEASLDEPWQGTQSTIGAYTPRARTPRTPRTPQTPKAQRSVGFAPGPSHGSGALDGQAPSASGRIVRPQSRSFTARTNPVAAWLDSSGAPRDPDAASDDVKDGRPQTNRPARQRSVPAGLLETLPITPTAGTRHVQFGDDRAAAPPRSILEPAPDLMHGLSTRGILETAPELHELIRSKSPLPRPTSSCAKSAFPKGPAAVPRYLLETTRDFNRSPHPHSGAWRQNGSDSGSSGNGRRAASPGPLPLSQTAGPTHFGSRRAPVPATTRVLASRHAEVLVSAPRLGRLGSAPLQHPGLHVSFSGSVQPAHQGNDVESQRQSSRSFSGSLTSPDARQAASGLPPMETPAWTKGPASGLPAPERHAVHADAQHRATLPQHSDVAELHTMRGCSASSQYAPSGQFVPELRLGRLTLSAASRQRLISEAAMPVAGPHAPQLSPPPDESSRDMHISPKDLKPIKVSRKYGKHDTRVRLPRFLRKVCGLY